MESLRVRYRRLSPDVPVPQYQTAGSVAFDLSAAADATVAPGSVALLRTGLIVEVPEGYALLLASRSSGPTKLGLHTPHGFGVIDQDYHGPADELLVQVFNPGTAPVTIATGTRIAQALIVPILRATLEEADALADTSRGGFGSTGGHG